MKYLYISLLALISLPQFLSATTKLAQITNTTTSSATIENAPQGASVTYRKSAGNYPSTYTNGFTGTMTISGFDGYTIKAIEMEMHETTSGRATFDISIGNQKILTNWDSYGKVAESSLFSWYEIPLAGEYTITTGKDITINIECTQSTFYWHGVRILYKRTGEDDSETVHISSALYATYCPLVDLALPENRDLKAYYVSDWTANSLTFTPLPTSIIPARMGVLLKGTANTNYTLQPTSDNSTIDVNDNKLIGTILPTSLEDGSAFILAMQNNQVGFYPCSASTLSDGKAYLSVAAWQSDIQAVPGPMRMIFLDDAEDTATSLSDLMSTSPTVTSPHTTPSSALSGCYNLLGQPIQQPSQSGFYIINGQKVFIK